MGYYFDSQCCRKKYISNFLNSTTIIKDNIVTRLNIRVRTVHSVQSSSTIFKQGKTVYNTATN